MKKISIIIASIILLSIIATFLSYEKQVIEIKNEIVKIDTIKFDYNKIPSPYKK